MKYFSNKYLIPVVAVMGIIIVAESSYLYYKVSVITNQQSGDEIVSEIGKLIELPKEENPTIATITDITKLKDQAFFQNAKNGDKVLIYANFGKAILYSPNLRKIIEVAPINIGTTSARITKP